MRILSAVTLAALAFAAFIRQPSFGAFEYEAASRTNPRLLETHVRTLTARPHSADHPDELQALARYIEAQFLASGGEVERQEFRARNRAYTNVIARFGPKEGRELIVGAHYDAFGDHPGADDNASGTAGLLELARLLGAHRPQTPVTLVAYSTEEPPFYGSEEMGSAVHAASLAGRDFAGMICLEMIGYFGGEQTWPNWTFDLLYPDRGDFIAVAGGWADRTLTRHVKRAIRGAGGVPVYSFTGPRMTLDASDHRNYWASGRPAVLVTDTAYLRNPHYHTKRDTAETLDYRRMARVVDGVLGAALHARRIEN